MGSRIYWFSGSGNSLHLAKSLSEALDGAELVAAADALEMELEPSEKVGIVFPVYAWGPPLIVTRLIEKLPARAPGYLFIAASCGGNPGSAVAHTRRFLARRGLNLDAAFTVKMVENYPPLGGAPPAEEQKRKNTAADVEITRIKALVKDGTRGDFSQRSFIFNVLGRVMYPGFSRSLKKGKPSKFLADDRCTSCGICTKICPVGNVTMSEGQKPAWGSTCEACFACFHWCPEESVQYGGKTREKIRYHHPGATLKEMIRRE